MAAKTRVSVIAGLGRGATLLAVVTVQAVAFSAAYAAGMPTLYAAFAVASAVALALLAVSAGIFVVVRWLAADTRGGLP